MDYAITAKEILEQLGGEGNVSSVIYCMTRLRFVLKDETLVDDEAIKGIYGVLGIMKKGNQYQVIIGNGATACYKELLKLGSFGDTALEDTAKKESFLSKIINTLTSGKSSAPAKADDASPAKSTSTGYHAAQNQMEQDPKAAEAFDALEGILVSSPIEGASLPLSMVNDLIFSKAVLGQGAAIIPSKGQVVAPFDGTVSTVFDTKHVVNLVSPDGVKVIIHVGLDTVNLNGKHFIAHVEAGQAVKKGDLLLTFDMEALEAEGYDLITPVIISNTKEFKKVAVATGKAVHGGDSLIKVMK